LGPATSASVITEGGISQTQKETRQGNKEGEAQWEKSTSAAGSAKIKKQKNLSGGGEPT